MALVMVLWGMPSWEGVGMYVYVGRVSNDDMELVHRLVLNIHFCSRLRYIVKRELSMQVL